MDVEELRSRLTKPSSTQQVRRKYTYASPNDMGRKLKPNNQKKRSGRPPWVVAKEQKDRIAKMDDADRAKEIEILHRRAALEMAKRHPEPPQKITNGQVLCIDCDEPVQSKRLEAKPNAARCIECQCIYEKRERHCV